MGTFNTPIISPVWIRSAVSGHTDRNMTDRHTHTLISSSHIIVTGYHITMVAGPK